MKVDIETDSIFRRPNGRSFPGILNRTGFAAQLRCDRAARCPSPLADRFVRHCHAALEHPFVDLPQADIELKIQSDHAGEDVDEKAMIFVGRIHAGQATQLPQNL
ncbi:hypothetical protein V6766_22175 [Martelella sp. AMO21009]